MLDLDDENNDVYTDNPELGELRIVEDFLPPPEQLVLRPDGVKVTLRLSTSSLEYFKHKAAELNVPYQRMIRNLVDEYVRHMTAEESQNR
jgi:predicted DNA binding CopG/RHH family protein